MLQDTADLLDRLVENGQVRAEQFHGELTLRPGQHLGQLVGDRLFEKHGQTGQDVELLAHLLRDLSEAPSPFLARQEFDIVMAVADGMNVFRGLCRARRPGDRNDFGDRKEDLLDPDAHLHGFLKGCLRQHDGRSQNSPLVEGRDELLAEKREGHAGQDNERPEEGQHQLFSLKSFGQDGTILRSQKLRDGVPFRIPAAVDQKRRRQDGLQRNVEEHRAEEGGGHGEGRRPEHGTLEALEGQEREEDEDDDEARRKEVFPDVLGRFDNDLHRGRPVALFPEKPVNVLDHDDGPVGHLPDADGQAADGHDRELDAE